MDYDKILDKGDNLNTDSLIDNLSNKLIEHLISQNYMGCFINRIGVDSLSDNLIEHLISMNYMNSFINKIGVDNLVNAFVNNSDLWNEVKNRMIH